MILLLGTGEATKIENNKSPAAKVMDEAIDLAIEGRSPYPEHAAFIDADAPSVGHEIERAVELLPDQQTTSPSASRAALSFSACLYATTT